MPTENGSCELPDNCKNVKCTDSIIAENSLKFVSDIQVQIDVSLGYLEMSASQIMDLMPGQILEFKLPAEEMLTLTVEGEKIAIAKLVEQGEGLALQIISLEDDEIDGEINK